MVRLLKDKLTNAKQQSADALLLVLWQVRDRRLSAEALGEITHLRATSYPHLARLQKEGFVVPEWFTEGAEPTLGYVLTDKGREYVAVKLEDGLLDERKASSSLNPLVARLAAWFG